MEIAINEDAMTASISWAHRAEECFHVAWMGEAERIGGGNTALAWSTAGLLDQVTPEGQVALRVGIPFGGGFGFGEHVESLYP